MDRAWLTCGYSHGGGQLPFGRLIFAYYCYVIMKQDEWKNLLGCFPNDRKGTARLWW